MLTGQKPIAELDLFSHHDKLSVMPSNQSLFAASESLREDTALPAWQTRLATAFEDFAKYYLCDWVVVDCPPDLDYTIAAAAGRRSGYYPRDPGRRRVDGLQGYPGPDRQRTGRKPPKLQAAALWVRVPNAWTPPETFNIPAVRWLKTRIRESTPVLRAKNAARPVRLESPGCYAARDYKALAAEIKGDAQ